MIVDLPHDADLYHSALDHAVVVRLGDRLVGQPAAAPRGGAEEEALVVLVEAGGIEVGIEPLLQGVVGRHFVLLDALLVQPHPPALARQVVVADPHGCRRPDAGEGVDAS